jgi:WD40 repeat protein
MLDLETSSNTNATVPNTSNDPNSTITVGQNGTHNNNTHGQSHYNLMNVFRPGHGDLVRTIQCDERFIVSGSYDLTLKIWDAKTKKCLVDIVHAHSNRVSLV